MYYKVWKFYIDTTYIHLLLLMYISAIVSLFSTYTAQYYFDYYNEYIRAGYLESNEIVKSIYSVFVGSAPISVISTEVFFLTSFLFGVRLMFSFKDYLEKHFGVVKIEEQKEQNIYVVMSKDELLESIYTIIEETQNLKNDKDK
ncbi:MAG: hypothetical protein QXE05_04815 [Nitrososphaeria archaeon]